jgi:hypothetical protein
MVVRVPDLRIALFNVVARRALHVVYSGRGVACSAEFIRRPEEIKLMSSRQRLRRTTRSDESGGDSVEIKMRENF